LGHPDNLGGLGHTDEAGKNIIVRRLSRARAGEIVARSANAQGSDDDPSVEHATAHDASVRRGTVDTCNYQITSSRRRSPKLTMKRSPKIPMRVWLQPLARRPLLLGPTLGCDELIRHSTHAAARSRRLTFCPPRAGIDPLASPERPRVISAVTPVARAP